MICDVFQTMNVGLSPLFVPLFVTSTTVTQSKHDDHMLLGCFHNCSDITWTILSVLWFSCSYSRQCSNPSTAVSSMSLFIVTPPFAFYIMHTLLLSSIVWQIHSSLVQINTFPDEIAKFVDFAKLRRWWSVTIWCSVVHVRVVNGF